MKREIEANARTGVAKTMGSRGIKRKKYRARNVQIDTQSSTELCLSAVLRLYSFSCCGDLQP